MARPLDHLLKELETMLLKMGEKVEVSIHKAMKSFEKSDLLLAQEVIREDVDIDEMEEKIDDTVIRLIATQQPVATDLRKILTAMNIASDLERMADLAVDIAEEAMEAERHDKNSKLIHFSLILTMGQMTQQMVHDGLNSYIDGNTDFAKMLSRRDDQIDDYYEQIIRQMGDYLGNKSPYAEEARKVCFVARFLERIADHATNIAESVVYMETGKRMDLN